MGTSCYLKKQRIRRDGKKFRALIAVNDDATVTLPANARVSFVSVAGCSAGTTAAVLTGPHTRTIKTKLLAAGQRVVIDRVERGTLVTLQAGFQAYIDSGLGKWRRIAVA